MIQPAHAQPAKSLDFVLRYGLPVIQFPPREHHFCAQSLIPTPDPQSSFAELLSESTTLSQVILHSQGQSEGMGGPGGWWKADFLLHLASPCLLNLSWRWASARPPASLRLRASPPHLWGHSGVGEWGSGFLISVMSWSTESWGYGERENEKFVDLVPGVIKPWASLVTAFL